MNTEIRQERQQGRDRVAEYMIKASSPFLSEPDVSVEVVNSGLVLTTVVVRVKIPTQKGTGEGADIVNPVGL